MGLINVFFDTNVVIFIFSVHLSNVITILRCHHSGVLIVKKLKCLIYFKTDSAIFPYIAIFLNAVILSVFMK